MWGWPRLSRAGGTSCLAPSARRPAGAWGRRAAPGCDPLVVLAAVFLILEPFPLLGRGEVGMSSYFLRVCFHE